MEEEQVLVTKMLALDTQIDPFTSSWGAVCRPQFNEAVQKWLLPLGWEAELEQRGIIYTEIDIQTQTDELGIET